MGLSNEERLVKIFWAVEQLTDLVKHPEGLGNDLLVKDYQYGERFARNVSRLRTITGEMWHNFLSKHSSSAYWLLGGEADNPVSGPSGPWAAAIVSLCEEHQPKGDNWVEGIKVPFNPFISFLNIGGLLAASKGGVLRKALYDFYGWTEFLSYALRRYNDEFHHGLSKLDKNLSDLQGICFSLFARDDHFARAYVLNRILVALYGGEYGKDDDDVRAAFLKVNLHHDLSRPMVDCTTTEVIKWDAWRLQHKVTPQNRILLALRIAGRRFHYDHNCSDLIKWTETAKPKPRQDVIKREFTKCQQAHTKKEAETTNAYLSETDINCAIHGYQADDWTQKKDQPEKG